MREANSLPARSYTSELRECCCRLSTSTRMLAKLWLLFVCTGCDKPATSPDVSMLSNAQLHAHVGRTVAFRGKFELAGKFGPYIRAEHSHVYIEPRGSFTWGTEYGQLQGKLVSATGTLQFRHFEPKKGDEPFVEPYVATPVDHFYFEAENTQIRLDQ